MLMVFHATVYVLNIFWAQKTTSDNTVRQYFICKPEAGAVDY